MDGLEQALCQWERFGAGEAHPIRTGAHPARVIGWLLVNPLTLFAMIPTLLSGGV